MKQLLLLLSLMIMTTACAQRSYRSITEYNGNIGIGTATPDERLTVKGKIHTREVIVDLKGAVAPDFVFETYYEGSSNVNKAYRFMSLTEIEQFIKVHHHLPEIPAAISLEENGLELKKMNLLLLQKIEELTLHTIAQQKEINLLKEKMAQLEN